jgi:hypothetical protein
MHRVTLALAIVLALPVALAHAHGAPHPVINGSTKQGNVTLTEAHDFKLPTVTFDCPPPENSKSCRVVATARTTSKYRLKPGGKKRVVSLGKLSFKIRSNGEGVEIRPIALTEQAHKLLEGRSSLRGKATVSITHHEKISRSFKFKLHDHDE